MGLTSGARHPIFKAALRNFHDGLAKWGIAAALTPTAAHGPGGAPMFRNEKGLVSYVFTNPPQDTVLNHLDYVYVVKPSEGEDA